MCVWSYIYNIVFTQHVEYFMNFVMGAIRVFRTNLQYTIIVTFL